MTYVWGRSVAKAAEAIFNLTQSRATVAVYTVAVVAHLAVALEVRAFECDLSFSATQATDEPLGSGRQTIDTNLPVLPGGGAVKP